jgi:hypothetical protein
MQEMYPKWNISPRLKWTMLTNVMAMKLTGVDIASPT